MGADFYAFLADVVLLLHAGFVLFVLGGQLLILLGWWRGWHWPRRWWFRATHLGAIGFVVLQSWVGAICPLTEFESRLRQAAGQRPYEVGFVSHWVQQLLFYSAPAWVFAVVYTAFGALVLATFVRYPPRGNARWNRRSKGAE
jgi:hypothetical protein